MIRHVVIFRWIAEATEEQKQQVAAELRRLPALLPVLRAYHVGPDLGLVEGNFQFAVVADFDDLEGLQVYRDNPEHREIIAKFIQPMAAQRAAVQYEF
jgi:Stress responsive A/B Barrel Domain